LRRRAGVTVAEDGWNEQESTLHECVAPCCTLGNIIADIRMSDQVPRFGRQG
jgi:hypothetical protein